MGTLTVGVLADDLTGATDTVVQFREAGWPAYLLLSGDLPDGVLAQADAVALARSLDTRALNHDDASRVTQQAARQQLDSGTQRLYLKIDSTMRGSIAGQVRGALQAWSRQHPAAIAVLCPAYPPMGRTVRDGRVYVNGVPLHDSPAGHDPVTPVATSTLTDLVPGAAHVEQADGPGVLARRLREAAPDGGIVTVDAANEQDLRRLAEAAEIVGESAVWAGSAGLARHLAEVWRPGTSFVTAPDPTPTGEGRVVVCVSSLNAVSLDQARHLENSFSSELVGLEVAAADLSDTTRLHELVSPVAARDVRVVLVQPDPRRASGGDRTDAARIVARGLAKAIAQILDAGGTTGLVLVGGDGAEATLRLLGAQALEMRSQPSEGVPLTRVVGGSADGLAVVTKAGGFGTTSTITDVVSAMLGHKEGST
ncbi:four-carbon acid sugar kinase family protein [Segeticoccus rhizosphaerae]|uniref:four-carbon acid sugar kinase family protein n=1 Tax=Segeticoccus rhizosphaerae TaxID=1104777 RepID=UPI0010BF6AE4|nr:four-carbon acid sugar kinase family protein [Ornithinicoccus soli]